MDELTGAAGQAAVKINRKWLLILVVALLILLGVLLVALPGNIAVYQMYWGKENIQNLFYEDLGLSFAWSSFIAVVAAFFYALAWMPLSLWTLRVSVWRFDNRQLLVAFGCWVLVYGHVPLMHALFGTDVCFNQRTGVPIKWYVENANGDITLFDSGGFDTITRVEKRPVKPEICAQFARQKNNATPRKITADISEIKFFDSATGRPRVWYSMAPGGKFDLFDSNGFNPVTSESLFPVTQEIVREIIDQATKEADEKKRAETKRLEDVEKAARTRAAEESRRGDDEARRQKPDKAQQDEASKRREAQDRRRETEDVPKPSYRYWRSGTGAVVEYVQSGSSITLVFVKPSQANVQRGVVPGSRAFAGTFVGSGNRVSGTAIGYVQPGCTVEVQSTLTVEANQLIQQNEGSGAACGFPLFNPTTIVLTPAN